MSLLFQPHNSELVGLLVLATGLFTLPIHTALSRWVSHADTPPRHPSETHFITIHKVHFFLGEVLNADRLENQ